jgi:hypothetical protein
MLAGIVAMFLPLETMGIALPEDTDDLHPLTSQFGNLESSKGEPEHASSAAMAPATVKQGNTVEASNPFATGQSLPSSGTAGEYQDQYGLDSDADKVH